MTVSNQLVPGTTIALDGGLYRVETSVKVQAPKGQPFIKATLRELRTDELTERNFTLDQKLDEVALAERHLEFLYPEDQQFVFLDVATLDLVRVEGDVVGDRARYLKEGTAVRAICYGSTIFNIDLPQFLEIMVMKVENPEGKLASAATTKWAVLETGARVEVPLFIEAGDIVKCDTSNNEYIQRV